MSVGKPPVYGGLYPNTGVNAVMPGFTIPDVNIYEQAVQPKPISDGSLKKQFDWLGLLQGGALQTYSFLLSLIGNKIQSNQEKEYLGLVNKYNLEQWNRENAYNDPLEQRRRLERAGFNPNLALGDAGNGASMTPINNTPSAGNPMSSFGGILSSVLNAQQVASEIDVNKATAENLRASAEQNKASAGYLSGLLEGLPMKRSLDESQKNYIDKMDKVLDSQIDLEASQIALNWANVEYVDAKTFEQRVDNYFADLRNQLELELKESQIYYNRNAIGAMFQELAIQAKESNARIKKLNAETKTIKQELDDYMNSADRICARYLGEYYKQFGDFDKGFMDFMDHGHRLFGNLLGDVGKVISIGFGVGNYSHVSSHANQRHVINRYEMKGRHKTGNGTQTYEWYD